MFESRGYQRRYLRAPYRQEILFSTEDFIFKANTINISEGGLLLDQIGHFPEDDIIPFMVILPQYPLFKDFTLAKLLAYDPTSLEPKVVRFKAMMARKIGLESKVDGVFASQIGLQIKEVSNFDQAKISSYVDVFASNLIYLQVLLDSLHADKNNLTRIRKISEYLGYQKDMKLALLRKIVQEDYRSLQWL